MENILSFKFISYFIIIFAGIFTSSTIIKRTNCTGKLISLFNINSKLKLFIFVLIVYFAFYIILNLLSTYFKFLTDYTINNIGTFILGMLISIYSKVDEKLQID